MVASLNRQIGNSWNKDQPSSAVLGKVEFEKATKDYFDSVSRYSPRQVSPTRFPFLSRLLASCEAPVPLYSDEFVRSIDPPRNLPLAVRDLRAEVCDGGGGRRPHDLVVKSGRKDAKGHL